MNWSQIDEINNLEEIDLDFSRSSKRMKMNEDVDEIEIDLNINLKYIHKKIKKLGAEVKEIVAALENLHNEISILL